MHLALRAAQASAPGVLAASQPATVIIVTRFDDPVPAGCTSNANCSLREAVIAANAADNLDVIQLPAGTYPLTHTGNDDTASAGDLDLLHSVQLTVIAGVTATVTAGASFNDRLFHLQGFDTHVSMTGIDIEHGNTHTITGTAARLGPLQALDGTRLLGGHPLLHGSPALGAGHDATCAATDQRGVGRPVGAHCDMGAFEAQNLLWVYLPLVLR